MTKVPRRSDNMNVHSLFYLFSLFAIIDASSTTLSQSLIPNNFTYISMNQNPECTDQSCEQGCSPEQCEGCTGCGEEIETITVKIEWQHKGSTIYTEDEVQDCIFSLAKDLIVSHIELIYFNNYFIKDVKDGHSLFLIQGSILSDLVPNAQEMELGEALEKAVFEALK